MDQGQSLQEWARRQARGGESINQLVTKSLLSPPEDLVPCRVAQWGSKERGKEDRNLHFVLQQFKSIRLGSLYLETTKHSVALPSHTEVEVTHVERKIQL